jgi:polysaccharide biosynthesis transport protein
MTLSQFLSILRARWKLAASVFFGTVVLAVVISLVLPKQYTATASVVVDARPDPLNGPMVNAALVSTQADILSSDRVMRRVIHDMKLDENPDVHAQWMDDTGGQGTITDWLGNSFSKQLTITPGKDSNVVQVSFQAPDANFAASMANAFVQAYLETAIELRTDPARRYSSFFSQQADQARKTLETAQTRLTAFQQTKGIVSDEGRLDIESSRLNDLSSQLVALQTIASDSSSRNAQAAAAGDRLSETLNNPVVANIKMQLSKAQSDLQELTTRLGDAHPQVQQVRANIAELQARLDAETKRVASSVSVTATINSARVADLKSQLEAQRQKVLKLQSERDDMAVLQRDVDNAQKTYDAIVAHQNQSALEGQTRDANVNALSAATPPIKPSSPKLILNTAVAIVLGMLLGVGVSLWREMVDRRVRSTQDLIQALGLPILGVMPKPLLAKQAKGSVPSMGHKVISGRLPASTK